MIRKTAGAALFVLGLIGVAVSICTLAVPALLFGFCLIVAMIGYVLMADA